MIHSMSMPRLRRNSTCFQPDPPQIIDIREIDPPDIVQILANLSQKYF